MRPHCIFIASLVLFACCSLAHSKFIQGPDKCCFSFSNIRIPVKQVVSIHTTHLECHRSGNIVILKDQREICVDPMEKWVEKLKKKWTPTFDNIESELSSGEKA